MKRIGDDVFIYQKYMRNRDGEINEKRKESVTVITHPEKKVFNI